MRSLLANSSNTLTTLILIKRVKFESRRERGQWKKYVYKGLYTCFREIKMLVAAVETTLTTDNHLTTDQ